MSTATSSTVCLVLFVLSVSAVVQAVSSPDGGKCPDECDLSTCPTVDKCEAGIIKDRCGCCQVCGQKEGHRCSNATIKELSKEYEKYFGCGDNLLCVLRTDTNPDDPAEAICECKDQQKVCGSDGVTYDNICILTEERYRRRDGLVVKSDNPCRSAPVIVTSPKDISNKSGQNVAFDCEVIGWPVPVIEWRYSGNSAQLQELPGDDPNVALQTRGGPNNYEVSGWLQILDIKQSNAGMYTCVAVNDEGETRSSAKLLVDGVPLGKTAGNEV